MANLKPICSIEGCGKPARTRGWCPTHYKRWQKHGSPHVTERRKPRQTHCNVAGCPDKHASKGYCSRHYQRFSTYGSPYAGKDGLRNGEASRWLHDHKDHTGVGCLIWPFARGRAGYGNVYYEGAYTNAHRAMCVIKNGEPPTPEHQAAHSCGNGHLGCVHPEHLRWATRLENETDKLAHGTVRRGCKVPTSKLTEGDVRRIRVSSESGATLAGRFNVSPQAISRVRTGKSWGWLK